LNKDLSASTNPSVEFIKENLKQRIVSLRKELEFNEGLSEFQDHSNILEILERLNSDDYLEQVGFRFKTNSEYNGDIVIDGETFEEWKTQDFNEDDIVLNRILIEQSIKLIKEDKNKLIEIIKKIVDEKF
jgi:hypothetical protein